MGGVLFCNHPPLLRNRFLDLADFLTFRATGDDTRSVCTTVCKWTYLAHCGGWSDSYWKQIGLGEFVDEKYNRIGQRIRPLGEAVGKMGKRKRISDRAGL